MPRSYLISAYAKIRGMYLLQRIRVIVHKLWLKRRLTIPIGVLLGSIFIYSIIFFISKPVEFSYTGQTCVRQLTILPSLHKTVGATAYQVTYESNLAGVVSIKACFVPTQPPTEGVRTLQTAPFGGLLARKTFNIHVGNAPEVRANALDKLVPVTAPLQLALSSNDATFHYKLAVNAREALCSSGDKILKCPLVPLDLEQGKAYTFELHRYFDDRPVATVLSKEATTLSAVTVTSASVTGETTIYDKPRSFSISTDKPLTSATASLVKVTGDTTEAVPAEVRFADNVTTVTIQNELDRSSMYRLSLSDVTATDGSSLTTPYSVTFKVSGGPKVTGVSVGTTGVSPSAKIVVSFDQDISTSQDVKNFASITGGSAVIGRTKNQITYTLQNLPKCSDFSLQIGRGLLSNYDIASETDWSFSAKTICYTVSTFGYSAKGKPLSAYYFGSGNTTILYTASIHGNEYGTRSLMEAWITELERNAGNIPADRRIVVVPTINPDGAALGIRNNAANVDINRNFDVSDWQSDISAPNGAPIVRGGGEAPMSEPETKAIAALTLQLRPRLTMSYHSTAGYAIGNMAGDSATLAATYARMTGYANQTGNSSNAFDYKISGTYDDWIAEKLGLPSVLVELSRSNTSEFTRNVNAMWTMLKS